MKLVNMILNLSEKMSAKQKTDALNAVLSKLKLKHTDIKKNMDQIADFIADSAGYTDEETKQLIDWIQDMID